MLLLANDLASYFALYHNMLVERDAHLTIQPANPSKRNSAKDSAMSTKHLPFVQNSTIVKPRAKAYRLLSEIINRIQFGKTKMPNISKINDYVKRENVDFLYSLTQDNNKPNTIRSSLADSAFDVGSFNTFLNTRNREDSGVIERENQIRQFVTNLLENAPIQVKSLIAYTADPLLVSRQMQQVLSTDNLDNSFDYVSSFQYKTQVINQLEVLDGYGQNSEGNTMLKKPEWKPYKDADVRSERSYLCRIMPYVNEEYLVDRNKNYDLPTYDEYFIMVT